MKIDSGKAEMLRKSKAKQKQTKQTPKQNNHSQKQSSNGSDQNFARW